MWIFYIDILSLLIIVTPTRQRAEETQIGRWRAALVIRFEEIVKYSLMNVRRMCFLFVFCWLWHCMIWQIPFIPIHQNVHRHLNATQRHSWTLELLSLSRICHEKTSTKYVQEKKNSWMYFFTSCSKGVCDVILASDYTFEQQHYTLLCVAVLLHWVHLFLFSKPFFFKNSNSIKGKNIFFFYKTKYYNI